MTQKEATLLAVMDQKLDDLKLTFTEYKQDHNNEHKLMWKLIIGIPSFLLVVFSVVMIIVNLGGNQ